MMRRGGIVCLLGLVLLTGFAVVSTGWLYWRSFTLEGEKRAVPRDNTSDPFMDPSGRRWLQGRPHHWRACLLRN
jgi:hypothetical protein